MGYSNYAPHIIYGFEDCETHGILNYDGKHVKVYAIEVNKGYNYGAFIGIECYIDNGKLGYGYEAHKELLEVIKKYAKYHKVDEDDIALGYMPVISGDWKAEDTYTFDDDDSEEE